MVVGTEGQPGDLATADREFAQLVAEADIGALYSVEELAVEVAESAQRAVSQNHPKLKPNRATQ